MGDADQSDSGPISQPGIRAPAAGSKPVFRTGLDWKPGAEDDSARPVTATVSTVSVSVRRGRPGGPFKLPLIRDAVEEEIRPRPGGIFLYDQQGDREYGNTQRFSGRRYHQRR